MLWYHSGASSSPPTQGMRLLTLFPLAPSHPSESKLVCKTKRFYDHILCECWLFADLKKIQERRERLNFVCTRAELIGCLTLGKLSLIQTFLETSGVSKEKLPSPDGKACVSTQSTIIRGIPFKLSDQLMDFIEQLKHVLGNNSVASSQQQLWCYCLVQTK